MSKKQGAMLPTLWVAWIEDGDDDAAYVPSDLNAVREQAEEWYTDEPNQTIHIGRITPSETLDPRDESFPWRKA